MDVLSDHPALIATLIFVARVADVSLGTLRTLVLYRGRKYIAAGIGFVEILIWVYAVSSVIQNLDQWYLGVAYAAGFAVGNIVGVTLENKLAMGMELVRAVSLDPSIELAAHVRQAGFDVIEIEGRENGASVEILLIVEKRRKVPRLLGLIRKTDPAAYVTITDVKDSVSQNQVRRAEASKFPIPWKKK